MRNGYIGWAFCFGPECIMKCGGIWFLTPNRQSLYNMVNMVKSQKYDLTRQRYYQILAAFYEEGAEGLLLQNPGPKTDYRRTDQVVRLVIRCRFLDPESSPAVIAQKIRQQSHSISQRSVERIIADYGLPKKTLHT